MKKQSILLTFTLILVLVVTGCVAPAAPAPTQASGAQAPAATQTSAPAPSGEKVTLKLTIMGTEDQSKQLQEWIPRFEAANPDIKVEYEVLDWGTGKTKILTSYAAGVGPDVTMAYHSDLPTWAENGAFSPLEDYFKEEDFLKGVLNTGFYKGHLYAVPWDVKTYSYYWRKDIYREVGLDPEKPAETWDELIDQAQKLTKRDASGNLERVGFYVMAGHPYKGVTQLIEFIWSAGGDIFSEDGCKATFNEQPGVDAAQLLADLSLKYKVYEPGAITVENTDFGQGKVASLTSNVATRGFLTNFPDVIPDVGVTTVPHKAGAQSYTQVGGNYLGISKTTKHFEQSLRLLKFLIETPDIARDYSLVEAGIPALKAAANEEYFNTDPFGERWVEIIEEYGRTIPLHGNWVEIQDHIRNAHDQIWLEGKDAKTVLDEAAAKVQAVLDANGCAEMPKR